MKKLYEINNAGGERYYKAHGDCICHWCFDDFKLHEYIAGEEEE